MPDRRAYKTLAKIAFGSKQDFISENQGKIKPEIMDLAIQMWFSPKSIKLSAQEQSNRRKRIIGQVNKKNSERGLIKASIKIKKKTLELIRQLVEESGFTKNRKYKLRVFLLEMATWKEYIKNMSYEEMRTMEAIYWDFSVHVFKRHIPLPASLLGRWVSGDLPARKPVERFEEDILNKIKCETDRELFINSYYLDCTGKRYVLKKTVTEEEKLAMRKVLKSIGYVNKSNTKYIEFMKYLIQKEVIELKVVYSTHGRCNYYKINL